MGRRSLSDEALSWLCLIAGLAVIFGLVRGIVWLVFQLTHMS